ncbi:GNAT family acetyltransferase [Subtercola boreus]|uniref:GNAT family acetyltransferase n=1 Tax=Subtercola boreus TaxID=120213 RepID=A0A3E0VEF4_9MICO|nr:GNAT family acetyltransferase [Subtercola boreus]RFA08306.1 GNAT family acetyltransferase [Subtercola boreus]TQL54794.1 ribosomal protein S18 acetylase RimI-like enzyme [Subtercola boreus]
MQLRPFDTSDTDSVIALWQSSGLVRPWNDPHKDIARKLTVQPDLFIVGVDDRTGEATAGAIVAAMMVGFDGHRGWVNYLAVAPEHRGHGHGRTLMAEAERLLIALGCPKLNLQVRAGNENVLAFYEALGYEPDHTVSLGKRLIAD